MQMLLDESEEFGVTAGLGLIPGRVIPVPANTVDGQLQKIPHIGWNDLVKVPDGNTWDNTLLQDIDIGEAVYFVHSFMAVPMTPELTLAHCVYGGIPVSAVIQNKNVLESAIDNVSEKFNCSQYVIKAQIHAGGRGKGGGVKFCVDKAKALENGKNILGMNLVTPQTGSEGQLVRKIMIGEAIDISKEYYVVWYAVWGNRE